MAAQSELVANDLIYLLRVSLSLGRLHHLADEEPQHFLFATTQLVELFRVRCDQLIDDLTITGNPEQCAQRIQAYEGVADELILARTGQRDDTRGLADYQEMFELISQCSD